MDSELNFNNKKFLSSKRAGEEASYTNDYVARLCRNGKVKGRMVGRTWYVEEESFQKFLNEHTARKEDRKKQLASERKKEYIEAALEQKRSMLSSVFLLLTNGNILQRAGVFVAIVFVVFGIYFASVSGPSGLAKNVRNSYTSFVKIVDNTALFFMHSQQLVAQEGIKNASGIFARQASVVVNGGVASVSESVTNFFEYVLKLATGALRSLAVKGDDGSQSFDQTENFQKEEKQFAQTNKEREGVVVVQSEGLSENEIRKKEIEDAFSDEIKIIPDEDGRSGIIKPVFKTPGEEEYLYVLVPIDEKIAEK